MGTASFYLPGSSLQEKFSAAANTYTSMQETIHSQVQNALKAPEEFWTLLPDIIFSGINGTCFFFMHNRPLQN